MSTVTLTIGPKTYSVACADGEEAHISALGAIIAEKYAQLGNARAPLEAQNLLFAALFLADELAEARKRTPPESASAPGPATSADPQALEALRAAIAELEDDLAAARAQATAASGTGAPQIEAFEDSVLAEALAGQLELLATQVEANASALEAAAVNA
jgi:cell division protein ZapA